MAHRPSTIDKLGKSLREEVDRLRVDEGKSIDEIVAHLKTMGAKVSRSAVGRHVLPLEDVAQRIRELRAVSEEYFKVAGDGDDAKIAKLNRQLLQGAITRITMRADDDDGDVTLSAKEAEQLARTMGHLSRSQKTDTDRILTERKEAAKETAQKASKNAEAVLKKTPGITKETIAAVRHVIGAAA